MMIVNEEIKLNKRQPTWNYILNDLALYSLMTKVIHSEEATNQEKFDFMYQIELLQQENARLKEIENKLNFIKNRKNQGASQENINKMAIEFVNSYLKEVE